MDADALEAEKRTSRLQVVQTTVDDSTCETYIFKDEDHTLGNALRYLIMKNPEVRFCGYTIPHPLECKIHLRIETFGVNCRDVLNKGLQDLHQLCEHVLETFQDQVGAYNAAHTKEEKMDMS